MRAECHPDSGCKYKGWVIPRWNELLTLVEECHRNFDGHRYVGWDFALTANGWVLIEGNWGQFLSEFTEGGGIREQFDNLMKQYMKKIIVILLLCLLFACSIFVKEDEFSYEKYSLKVLSRL